MSVTSSASSSETIFFSVSSSGRINVSTLSLLNTTSERSMDISIKSRLVQSATNTKAGPTTGHNSIIPAFIHVLKLFSFLLRWFQIRYTTTTRRFRTSEIINSLILPDILQSSPQFLYYSHSVQIFPAQNRHFLLLYLQEVHIAFHLEGFQDNHCLAVFLP